MDPRQPYPNIRSRSLLSMRLLFRISLNCIAKSSVCQACLVFARVGAGQNSGLSSIDIAVQYAGKSQWKHSARELFVWYTRRETSSRLQSQYIAGGGPLPEVLVQGDKHSSLRGFRLRAKDKVLFKFIKLCMHVKDLIPARYKVHLDLPVLYDLPRKKSPRMRMGADFESSWVSFTRIMIHETPKSSTLPGILSIRTNHQRNTIYEVPKAIFNTYRAYTARHPRRFSSRIRV